MVARKDSRINRKSITFHPTAVAAAKRLQEATGNSLNHHANSGIELLDQLYEALGGYSADHDVSTPRPVLILRKADGTEIRLLLVGLGMQT